MTSLKLCKICLVEKELTNYYIAYGNNHASYCKVCSNSKRKKNRLIKKPLKGFHIISEGVKLGMKTDKANGKNYRQLSEIYGFNSQTIRLWFSKTSYLKE